MAALTVVQTEEKGMFRCPNNVLAILLNSFSVDDHSDVLILSKRLHVEIFFSFIWYLPDVNI